MKRNIFCLSIILLLSFLSAINLVSAKSSKEFYHDLITECKKEGFSNSRVQPMCSKGFNHYVLVTFSKEAKDSVDNGQNAIQAINKFLNKKPPFKL